uniref:ABC transporter ATP-binding protein n=1 Tax=Thermosphaera aggregans TaxID=54254 RepID=A0A7C2FY29_9CREN
MCDNPLLRVSNLVVKYGTFTAVNKVSFQLCPGEVYCLLGPNGAGKTSTIRAIIGLVKPVEGFVEILGKNPYNEVVVKNYFGYVAEDPVLIDSLTPREHIEFVGAVRGVGKEFEEWVNYLVKAFEFSPYLDKPVYSLSRGNRQKASLILALMHKPRILILDEPFTGLDFQSSSVLRKIIEDWRNNSHGVLMSTHILEIAEKICTRIGVIVDGRLVFEDRIDSVKARLQGG